MSRYLTAGRFGFRFRVSAANCHLVRAADTGSVKNYSQVPANHAGPIGAGLYVLIHLIRSDHLIRIRADYDD